MKSPAKFQEFFVRYCLNDRMRFSVVASGLWLVCACFLADHLSAQSHLYTWKADYAGQWFGSAVAGAGDVNADGYDDVITGTGWNRSQSLSGIGARVFSGRDGKILISIQANDWGASLVAAAGDLNRDGYGDVGIVKYNPKVWLYELWLVSGKSRKRLRTVKLSGFRRPSVLASAGDINKDGYPDLLVGDPTYGFSRGGRVAVISGKDGSFLHDLKVGGLNYHSFGASLAGVGDVDRDGYADFLVGDPLFGTYKTAVGHGRCWLYSGKTGKVIRTFSEPKNRGMGFGSSACGLGDLDRDGVPDFAVGALGTSTFGRDSGAVFVYSGKTGSIRSTIYGQKAWWYFGTSIVGLGDWNQDGIPDMAIGAFGESSKALFAGAVFVHSGKDSKVLASFYGKQKWQGLGGGLAQGGDLDGDGRSDLLIGMSQHLGTKPILRSEFQAWSPAKQSFWSDRHQVSLAKQGKQVLQLDAGAKHAGRTYFVLGSMSGIQPGLKLGSVILPLQVDAYFWLTASVPNSGFLQGSLGVLDKKGQSRSTFTAVAGMPKSLIGARADHAYVVFGKGGFAMTSNWVPLLFEK